ncbi:hypothetical protein ACH4SP_18750 [Streptomyces sp. NPDC021093]|uniref:hypothetical protein n=1 Tax=Streptomyces sp. NPDC021093 TaxID=3365112 RepID=UPI0037939F84
MTVPAARRPARLLPPARLLLPVLAAALAVPLLTAAHQARPAPYGDRLTAHAPDPATAHAPDPATGPARRVRQRAADPALRVRAEAVEAYDRATGRNRWTYARTGHRPLAVHPAPGHAFTLWSDGLVTDTVRADGRAVRWHRAIPDFDGRAAGVLRPLDPAAEMLAVVSPRHIAAYRTADGDLRWVLPARPGCAFAADRVVTAGRTLLVAQPCAEPAAWTDQVVPVDSLGRVTPDRTPLGNGRAPRGAGPRKSVADDR